MKDSKYLNLITAIFTTILVVSNIIGGKLVAIGGYDRFSAVILFFPVSYIIGDVLTEVYGYGADRRVIWTGFVCNLLAVMVIAVAVQLPPAPSFKNQAAYALVLGSAPRLMAASFIAYLGGGFINAYVMAKLKIKTEGRQLWFRTIGSTVIAQIVDTGLFMFIAFFGVFPWHDVLVAILCEWLAKCALEAFATPLTYAVVGFLKRQEGIDHYDRATDFRPFKY